MARVHRYETRVTWTGNAGRGTSGYNAYERTHEVSAAGKPSIAGTADPVFRGVRERWNPEELLVASLSQCHMLWYLALCASEGIIVTEYTDDASGTMVETPDGGGRFEEVTLRPHATITARDQAERASDLHARAHEMCYIANSVNFQVNHEPAIRIAGDGRTSRAG